MLQITSTGLTIDRLDAILQRLQDGMKSIYGTDINIDPDTPDGEFIAIYGQEITDLNEVIAGIYGFSDPTKAIGKWLDIQVKYVGIERNQAEHSYLNDVKFVCEVGTIIPSGSIYTDENGISWQTVSTTTVTTNPTYIQLQSTELGSYYLASGKELTQKTVVLGVQSVFTTKVSELGNLEESDESLLMRFLRSYAINSNEDRAGIESKLINLSGVTDAKVYENYTDTEDSKGVAPHAINAVILGGADADIALLIARQKSLGCGVQGTQSVTVTYKGDDRVINFDRPSTLTVDVKVTATRKNSAVNVDKDALIATIKAKSFSIAENVFSGLLFCGLSTENYTIKSITLSNGSNTDVMEIPVGIRQYAVIGDVEVTVE